MPDTALTLSASPRLADFARQPEGHCLVGRCYLYWALPGAFGFSLWGCPGPSDLAALALALTVELSPACPPHVSLVDGSRLEGADPAAFNVLHRYVSEHHGRLAEQVTRLALVRPGGMVGAVIAGFFSVMPAPYPTAVVADASEAAAYLGLSREVVAAVDGAVAEARGDDRLLEALRALLRAETGLSLADACKRLGVSTRTLQRRLEARATSYVAEVAAARLDRARARMLESDDPLTDIALDAGFASPAHLSAAFRKAHGLSPSAWRKQMARR